ncbi:MAG TPA: hypothetical protein VG713_19905 [Pirellulales bacterium]|nr:hypothetical protein [Pirellulales bacterium]
MARKAPNTKSGAYPTPCSARREVFVLLDEADGDATRIFPGNACKYFGLYLNLHGELLTLDIHRRLKSGILRVVGSTPAADCRIEKNKILGDTLLSDAEFQWASACWLAATGETLQPART